MLRLLLLMTTLLACGGAAPATAPVQTPRIAMLWSRADLPGDKVANTARHAVILQGVEDYGLEWISEKYADVGGAMNPDMVPAARKKLARLAELNPRAVMLYEIYFFEADEKAYPPDSPWWQRDAGGKRERFWPGCYNMDIGNADYQHHIAARIAAAYEALDGKAGVYLDNLRFDDKAKSGWKALLGLVREKCPKLVIVVNAGWDSTDLEWIAPMINGIMYEDSVAHSGKKDTEAFYARIAATDRLLRQPRVSINERFGKRDDEPRMQRELVRTLAYTDQAFLYSDSTNGHKHKWWPQWDLPLGNALGEPAEPRPGELARREFGNGTVLWLPAAAKGPRMIELGRKMRVWGTGDEVSQVKVEPDSGVVLIAASP